MDDNAQYLITWAVQELADQGLTPWTSGNASMVDEQRQQMYIKPSGVLPELLDELDVSVIDIKTEDQVSGLKPSTDTETHLELYRRYPGMGAIVHTHSTFATAWAATYRDIPCGITMMADEFGGPICCSPYAQIGGKAIADAVEMVFTEFGPQKAVLLGGHGVLTFGETIQEAVKSAVLVEACAQTMYHAELLARSANNVKVLDQKEIASNFDRYQHRYGQTTE